MGVTDDIADELAIEALKLEGQTGDETIVTKVSEILGASSQTTQEAFLTSVRVRRAEARARVFIADMSRSIEAQEAENPPAVEGQETPPQPSAAPDPS